MKTRALILSFLLFGHSLLADETIKKPSKASMKHLRDVQSQLDQMKGKMKRLESMTQALEQIEKSEHKKDTKAKKSAEADLSKLCDVSSASKIKDCLMKTIREITSLADTVTEEVDHK